MARLVWLLSKFIYSHAVFHFPCPHLGYLPLGPVLPFSVAYREEQWVGTEQVMHKRNSWSLVFLLKLSLRVFPCTHIQWVLYFVYQKDRIQVYSTNTIHLPCSHFLDSKSMSLTVRSCPSLSLNRDMRLNMLTTKEDSNLEDSTDFLLKGEIAIMGGQTLRSAYLHFPDRFHPWTLSYALAPKQGCRKLVQAYLNQKVCWRQHWSPAS